MAEAEPAERSDANDAPHSRKRRIWFGTSVVLFLFLLYGVTTFIDVWLASRQDFVGSAEAAVVLGAAQYNGSPSPALEGRLDVAAELYFEGRVDIIVVTGGRREGDTTTEAKAGYDYLRTVADVPDSNLRLEVKGRSTYESLAATESFLRREGIDQVVLVTDPYHARRVVLVANEVGMEAEAVTTSAPSSFGRLGQEAGAVAVGRIVGFRRLDRFS